MPKFYFVVVLVRLVLPISLLISIALRPFGISIIYLLLFLLSPLICVPDNRTFKGWRGTYLLLNMLVSLLLLLLHIAWHTMLASVPPYGTLLEQYPILNVVGHNLGFVSYSKINPLRAVYYMLPEVISSIVSVLVYYVVKRLIIGPSAEQQQPETKYQGYPLLTSAGKYLCLILIMFSGIMHPSVTSGIYYLMFMGSATAWALGQPLSKAFAVVCRCVMAIMAVHIIVQLVYQCSVLEELYPPDKEFARYFGLTKFVTINTTNPSLFTYEATDNSMWATLASPFVILITYFVLALETRQLFKPKLIRVNSSKRRSVIPTASTARQMRQDSTGSVVVQDTESAVGSDSDPTLFDDIIMAIVDFFQVLIRSSYIATTITMMAWSIMYHSWLTFVFLMWANLVWLCHDQRGFMLKTSPVLVVYAMLLLIAEYIYGMNLLESELPSNLEHVNLQQIGLGRAENQSCLPLLIKSLFTCMFWVTLRQRVQELRQRRKSAVIADMAAPLQLTASTAASVLASREEEMKRSRLMLALGNILRSLCARYWIYVVVIMLFVIGISGKRMTIFRIIYMFLFLAFILMFQISWYWWRKLIYMFWIVVIIYSMINLILIYIYQFDNFSKIIEKYLLIDESLQRDLGLEPYHPADLFVKLLTPTSFLIITILQVHYFHKDFMAISDPKTRSNSIAPSRPESGKPSQDGVSTMRDDLPQLPSEDTNPRSQAGTEPDQSIELSSIQPAPTYGPSPRSHVRRMTTSGASPAALGAGAAPGPRVSDSLSALWHMAVRRYHASKDTAEEIINYVFIYLEQHLIKIVFISLMLLCVMNVCAMHVPIILLITPALWFNYGKQRVCILFMSILISIYFMAKMVYQIDYIKYASSDVNCSKDDSFTNITNNTSQFNNAKWLGFEKVGPKKQLVTILKGYIGLLALFTFHALVTYRQQSLRLSGALPKERTKTIFLNITRQEADKDLVHCIKYLLNYGFYKFGVEITLICLMGVIGSRMDLYAVLYAVWLLILVSIERSAKARWWPAFTVFITVLIPAQYMLAVGFLPQLCITYPWEGDDQQMKHIRTWMFLPYAESPPHAYKIIFDFLLLLFATRQIKVFNIENTVGSIYPGGSNSENIGKDWETPHFVNPVPDFLSYVGSWLDVLKRMVFLGMLWITLAIMFMTGTNRVNLFSMGYLIGSFIFLWQGTDFYLRPKSAILKWWSWLVRYNVVVVLVKTLLQIPGCILSKVMQEHACWLVQLLGIGCVDKFAGGNIANFLKMNYTKEAACSVPQEDIGLAWDGVCFAFLILQQRLFHSFYFYRVIDESKATTVLASRGAELIEELRIKQMHVQEDQESKILDKIKVKMERIKANQKKIQGVLSREPGHHDKAWDRPSYKPPTSHQKAVRSGDYYMFDEFDDTEIQMKDEDSSDDELVPRHMGIGKLHRKRTTDPVSDRRHMTEEGEEPLTELDEFAPLPENETVVDKIRALVETAWAFIASVLVSFTRHLMKYSRDYRYVSKTLSVEKKILKEKEGFGIGLREGSQMIWEPLPEALTRHHNVTILEENDDSMFKQHRSPFVHLGYALWYVVLAHTDVVCYIMVFINQIQSATILSIPLPLMVFMWGTLTIPRPTKTFWVTLIAYTEVIVLIKSMFQFEILPWNQKVIPANMPFTAPRIIGIERKYNYALYDLLLLLIIFLHRFILKSLGLWKESSPEIELRVDMEYPLDPEDTQLVAEGHIDEVGRKYVKLHDQSGPEEEHLSDTVVRRDGDRTDENDPGPSKGTEDDHYNVNDDEEPIIAVSTTLEKTYTHYPEVIVLSIKRYLRPMHRFFQRMLAPGARVTADIYAYMFLCDFFNFLVVIFGFAAFGTHQGDGGVKAYLEENKVPIPFLVMLILQFALIVIDRALYLRKFMLGKILFQYALIIGVHIWMFFVLPFITERTFNALLPPPMWYMLKCIYLLLSAYQIRCGYPRRIIGNFLCKSYHFLNMVFFRGFMVVPFLFELRTLMDWIWTDTSMTLMDWLKMEDIFASVFLLKCSRYLEDEFPQPRGSKKSNTVKYLLGGGVLAFVIAIIWFPLVFFAFGNSVGQPNPPTDVTVKIRIGPFLPIYQMSAQSNNIYVFTEQDYTQLSNLYARDRTAQTFLSNYVYNDVAVITINPNSTLKWEISPPELDRLKREAASNATLMVKFTYVITHPTNAVPNPPTIEDHREVPIAALTAGNPNPQREILRQLLDGTSPPDTWLNVQHLFPKFLKVFNKGTTKAAYQLLPTPTGPDFDEAEIEYRDVLLRLERDKDTDVMYWRVRESCAIRDPLLSVPLNNCDMLVMYTFNDKLFPETLNFISGSGIIGLYTTFVFLASRVLRGFFSGIYTRIMFDDLPNADRLLQLCLDIYLVREALELALEEDLFAKLVFLYRSPETMIKWSRPKEDENMEQPALPPSR